VIVVVTGVLLADVVTKAWAVRQGGAGGASSPVRIVHVANRGGSVGLGQGHPHLVATGATLGTFAVAWYPATFNLADLAPAGGLVEVRAQLLDRDAVDLAHLCRRDRRRHRSTWSAEGAHRHGLSSRR
jgi:lipoprotein signal peptidase